MIIELTQQPLGWLIEADFAPSGPARRLLIWWLHHHEQPISQPKTCGDKCTQQVSAAEPFSVSLPVNLKGAAARATSALEMEARPVEDIADARIIASVAEILLRRDRQVPQVGNAADVARPDICGGQQGSIVGNRSVSVIEESA